MYKLSIWEEFVARHHLIGGDWGRENEPNEHRYRAEIRIAAEALDEHGFIIDIYDLRDRLKDTVARFSGKMLNDLPGLEGQNPSLENLCRVFAEAFAEGLSLPNVAAVTVRIWEDDVAWASYRREPA